MLNTEQLPFSKEHAHESSGLLLWQVTTLWQRQITTCLKPFELTQVQFVLLASLLWLSKTENNITQVALARHSNMDIMMTSQVLRTLEKRGFVVRQPHPTDTRANIVLLTSLGTNLVIKAIPVVEQQDADFFSTLQEKQLDFNFYLEKLKSMKE